MRNPLRSEADAFRLVLYTLGYFGLIVVAALVHSALGLLVFLGLTGTVLYRVLGTRGRVEEQEVVAPVPSASGDRRILVVANETVGGDELLDTIRSKAEGTTQVLVGRPTLGVRRGRRAGRGRAAARGVARAPARGGARRAGRDRRCRPAAGPRRRDADVRG
jgi:hypothetical protein